MAPRQNTFFYAADFTAVAQGGNKEAAIQIAAGESFICQSLFLAANINAAHTFNSRSNIVGTTAGDAAATFDHVALATAPKLYRDASPNLAQNSGASLSQILLKIMQGDQPWMNTPIRADLLCGEPGRLFLLPQEIIIPGNTSLQVTLYNNLPASVGGVANATIDAQLCLVGVKGKIG